MGMHFRADSRNGRAGGVQGGVQGGVLHQGNLRAGWAWSSCHGNEGVMVWEKLPFFSIFGRGLRLEFEAEI